MGLTLEIIVDDIMHLMIKYRQARKTLGLYPLGATCYVLAMMGTALVTTTAVPTIAFLLLALSSFAPNANMGMMTALAFAFALIVDFVLLPAMLLVIDRDEPAGCRGGDERATSSFGLTARAR